MNLKYLLPICFSAIGLYGQVIAAPGDAAIDLNLYPPLSSGEASPWEKPEENKVAVPVVPGMNVWSAQGAVVPYSSYNGRRMPQYYQGMMPPQYQQGALPQFNQGMMAQPFQSRVMPQSAYYRGLPQPMIPNGYMGPGGGFPPNAPWSNNNGWNNGGPMNFSMPSMPWPF